jgi:hypothetical protein
MRSAKVCEELYINMVLAEEEIKEALGSTFSAMSQGPTIAEALNMLGNEGQA